MQQIVDFLIDYWQYISVALVIVLDVLILILKKRSKIVDPSIYSHLVYLVTMAEEQFGDGHGDEKLQWVIDQMSKDNPMYKGYGHTIEFIVDRILDTPTKKGGFGREKA